MLPLGRVSARYQRFPSRAPLNPLPHSLAADVPGSEFFKALLVVPIGEAYARGAEAAGRPGCDDQSWDGVDGAGAASLEVAEAIGSEEAGWLRARRDAQ